MLWVLDTNACIRVLNGTSAPLVERMRSTDPAHIALCSVVKAELLYGTIDGHKEFFRCPIPEDSRSMMNAVFRLPSEDLEAQFIADGLAAGFGGLKGHRSVGGIRVSMYNAMPLKGIEELVEFMTDFARKNG